MRQISRAAASRRAQSRRGAGSWQLALVALAGELLLLPLPVHGRPEALGVLERPDLGADQEVGGILLERLSPQPQRRGLIACGMGRHAGGEALERLRAHP